jgi:hypothetical protein
VTTTSEPASDHPIDLCRDQVANQDVYLGPQITVA